MTPYLILIGADHRNLGKSTLAAALADVLTKKGIPVYAVKLRATANPVSRLVREKQDEQKPSVHALFAAGCSGVWHVETDDRRRRERFTEILRSLPAGPLVLICESNALRNDLVPDLFIHLDGDGNDIKQSARQTRHLADIRIRAPFSEHDLETIVARLEQDQRIRP